MDLASSQGAMVAAGLSADEVQHWLSGIEDEVSLAAVNGPSSVTISGAQDAIERLAARLEDQGVFCRRLAVEYAFHSPQMEPVREELLHSLAHIRPRPTHSQWVSTVTGKPVEGLEGDAQYWWKNVRQCVRFSEAMSCLAEAGHGVAIEVGPHPVLAYSINECFQASGRSVRTVASLNRQKDDLQCITESLGSLYSLGSDIHWPGFYNEPSRKIPVPIYPFQLQRCWSESHESQVTRLAAPVHPLLGEAAPSPLPKWQQRVDLKLHRYLADHRVRGVCVYPAAAVIETALAAATAINESEVARLQRVQLHNPSILSEDRAQWVETLYDPDRRQIRLAFRPCDEEPWSQLATIGVSSQPPAEAPPLEGTFSQRLQEVRSRCTEGFDRERLYQHCQALGLDYGRAFQGITSGLRCDGEALVEVSLPGDLAQQDASGSNYRFHPALLDSCFHAIIAADAEFDHTVGGLYLPSEVREVTLYGRPTERITVHARVLSKSKKLLICDLDVFDSRGSLCLSLRHFESQRVGGRKADESTEDLIYGYTWSDQPLAASEADQLGDPALWLVFMDQGEVGRELGQRLRRRGDRVVEVYQQGHAAPVDGTPGLEVDPEDATSFDAMLGSVFADGNARPDGIVYLWGLDTPHAAELTTESLQRSTHLTAVAPMYLVQAWERLSGTAPSDLTIVTSGAQSADGQPEQTRVAQGPLIGFGRVIISEYATFRSKLVDLPAEIAASDLDDLVSELVGNDEEDEIMWRDGRRQVHRFVPLAGRPVSIDAAQTLPCQLRIGQTSGIEELSYATQPVRPLAAKELEIEVLASGLNFSDVMKALDLYPGLPDGPVDLGAECSGRVSRVGPGCTWQVGDEVLAVAPGAFATHVTVDESLVARKPNHLSHEQAATIPIAFLTADYALNECGRLKRDDSILIHSASGGVGLAAMQLARLAGLTVLATAGTDEKRQYVRQLGAKHVMDSRTLAFADETLRVTAGEGVDAVLNSLPGEAIAKGLSVLKAGGRFLEIGKRDIYTDSPLGLYPFRNNLAMFAIDLDQLFKRQPKRMGEMLRRLVRRFDSGQLQPLPTKTYSAEETKAAYRFMQQGKHIGKVVVSYDKKPTDICAGEYAPIAFEPEATYWLAGGLGGFGLEIARWMVQHGARGLVLSGRSKTVRPEAQKMIAELIRQGARVTVLPADITEPQDVRRVLTTIDHELPPLRGIIHTAMVLEDKLLVDLDRQTLDRVLYPKVLGGWNLHQETLGRELDCFIVFSSLSSVFGHAGQANYSAANALLDSLAYFRRAQGLPATAMNWGHLGEVGYLAERSQLGQRLKRQGVLSFTVKQATDCLEYALQTRALQQSVLRMDWSVWRGLGITNRVSPRFEHLLRSQRDCDPAGEDELPSAQGLRAASTGQRPMLIDRLLRTKAGSLLGIASEQIETDQALLEMGLDSLMAVEMRNWIESRMEVNLPISALMRSESLAQLTSSICELLGDVVRVEIAEAASTANSADTRVADHDAETLLEQLPNLGAEEVSQLLGQMLREQEIE